MGNRVDLAKLSDILAGRWVHETYPGSFAVALSHLDDQRHPEICVACGHAIGHARPARRCSDNATIHLGVDRDGYAYDCRQAW